MPVLSNRQLGQFASVSDFNYIPKRSANPCGLTPINLVGEEELEGVQPKLRILEKTLGFHAGSVDDHLDDVVLWFRPTNAWWWGIAKEAASLILEYGVGTLAAPFVCAWNAVFGDGCDLDDSYEFARKYNLIDNIEGWIPGIGEVRSEMFTGLFHFVHIGAGINRFNDIRGMNHARAGASYPGAMDITILASSDVSGLSLNAYASDGDDRYGQYDKVSRTVAAWQAHTIGHLEWSPVDNLARYGWERFARDGFTRADALAWPLHAIGDVVEPHHVVGTSSWGHRPYEDIVDNQEEVFFPLGGDARRGQLERILVEGFRLWKRFRFEQNISSFIESLAAETRTDVSLSGDWPYQDWPSVVYTFDGSEGEDQFDWEGTRTRCECCSSVSVR